MHLFNDTDHTNQYLFYIKQRLVKTEWEVSRRERDREREKHIKGVRDGVLEENKKRHGLRIDHWKRTCKYFK
jgi:hypothetical protein